MRIQEVIMLTYIVLLGPPGVGKGTQAKFIASELDLPHISTGDIFRTNIKQGNELGKLADSFISKGQLLPCCVNASPSLIAKTAPF
jgi:adenylate kinase